MKIAIASDHAGFKLKETLKDSLLSWGYEVVDFGTFGEEAVDYPDFISKAAEAVSNKKVPKAIVICGSGIGASIVANKFPDVRAALCHDIFSAKMSRLHNDANVLALGARIIGDELAKEILKCWLQTKFEGGRHLRRIKKIQELEKLILEGKSYA